MPKMHIAVFAVALPLLLASCDGPWNMEPEDPAPPRLRVSAMPVAGRTYDTIWLERIQAIDLAARGLAFVKPGSWMRVVRTDGPTPDTVVYRPSPDQPRAWIPQRSALVPYGATLRLEAHVVWNSADDFPRGDRTTESDLSAETTLPRKYALAKDMLAPLDALFGALSASATAVDAEALFSVLRGEDPGRVARFSVTPATCDSFLQGMFVVRSIRSGDTVWAILDDALGQGPLGEPVKRSLRPIQIRQDIDRERWGGMITAIGFDPSRARILGPVQRMGFEIRGDGKVRHSDSAAMFQPGDSRMLSVDDPEQPSILGYPERGELPMMVLNYTGRAVVRALAVDRSYASYHRAMMDNGSGAWSYTSVRGATGYFAGAAPDSLVFEVRAVRDTFSVAALRAAWCRDRAETAPEKLSPWELRVDCSAR